MFQHVAWFPAERIRYTMSLLGAKGPLLCKLSVGVTCGGAKMDGNLDSRFEKSGIKPWLGSLFSEDT